MYNTKVFKEAPKSWNVVFEEQTLPDGKSNKGRVQAYDGADLHRRRRALPDGATSRSSASRTPTSSTRTSTRPRSTCCAAQRTLVGRYWHDAMVQIDDFKNEGVVASGSWPFQVNLLQADKQPIASTIPEEGATGWADTTMMHVDAPHPNCAYMWLEHSLEPEAAGRPRRLVRLGAGGAGRLQGQRAARPTTGCETNGFDEFRQDQVLEDADGQVRSAEADCVPYYRWVIGLYRRDRRAVSRERESPAGVASTTLPGAFGHARNCRLLR